MPEYTVTVEGKEYDVDAPNERTAYTWAQQTHAIRKREFEKRVGETREQMRAEHDPTKGMGAGEKVLANLGAGFSSLGQGLRQITPGLKSPTDEEVREKRDIDARLAKSTDLGLGADWMPTAGSALQFAGEVAPMAAGGIAAGGLSRIPALARQAPRLTQAVRGLTGYGNTPIRAGAVGGGISGAAMPTTEDESRVLNTAIGTGAGAVLPLGVAGYRRLQRVKNPQVRAGEQLVEAIGEEEVPNVAQAVAQREAQRAGQAPAVRDIPETLAEASGNTGVARIESQLGRAEATGDDVAAFQRGQNVARYEAVQEATKDAPLAGQREAARRTTTDPMREQALQAAGQNQFFHQPVVDAVERVLQSDAGVSPAVRKVADLVASSMDQRANAAITPGRLYEIRKFLVDKLEGPAQIGDDMSAAVKGAQRQTMELIKSIDAALDQASGGKWTPYLQTFSRASRPVDEAVAAQRARAVFQEPNVPERGGAPDVTMTRLAKSITESQGEPSRRFPLALSASGGKQMGDVLEGIKRANEVQGARKLAGTAGGGSQTSTDLDRVLTEILRKGGGIPVLSQVLEAMGGKMSERTKHELVRLVQDPQAAMVAIRQAQQLRQPLTQAQQLLLQAASAGGAGSALPRAMQQRQETTYAP